MEPIVDMHKVCADLLGTPASDQRQDGATDESIRDLCTGGQRDVADAPAVMSSIEGLAGLFCAGYSPTELAQRPAVARS